MELYPPKKTVPHSRDTLDRLLAGRYFGPSEVPHGKGVRMEWELPAVNLKNEPVDFGVMHAAVEAFLAEYPFSRLQRDEDGCIFCAEDPQTGDRLWFPKSYNTLVLALGPEPDLNRLDSRFTAYYACLQEHLLAEHHSLTGMGINPHAGVNRRTPAAVEKEQILLHLHETAKISSGLSACHDRSNFEQFCCAAAAELPEDRTAVPESLTVLNSLEPLHALLFSNSPYGDLLCGRDPYFRNSLYGVNRRNVGLYDIAFSSEEEILAELRQMSILGVERDGRWIGFPPVSLERYWSGDPVPGIARRNGEFQPVTVSPQDGDISFFRPFKQIGLLPGGGLRFRGACMQPVRDRMCVPAYYAGLMKRLPQAKALLSRSGLYASGCRPEELRAQMICRVLPPPWDRTVLSDLLGQLIELAEDGLKERNFGEEKYLRVLYERAAQQTNPALDMLKKLESIYTLNECIQEYASL